MRKELWRFLFLLTNHRASDILMPLLQSFAFQNTTWFKFKKTAIVEISLLTAGIAMKRKITLIY